MRPKTRQAGMRGLSMVILLGVLFAPAFAHAQATDFAPACPDGLPGEAYAMSNADWQSIVENEPSFRDMESLYLEEFHNNTEWMAKTHDPLRPGKVLRDLRPSVARAVDLNLDGLTEVVVILPVCAKFNENCDVVVLNSTTPREIVAQGSGSCFAVGDPGQDGWRDLHLIHAETLGVDRPVSVLTELHRYDGGVYTFVELQSAVLVEGDRQ